MTRQQMLTNPIVIWRLKGNKRRADVAAQILCAAETLRRWEYGLTLPQNRELVRLAGAMGENPSTLLTDLEDWKKSVADPKPNSNEEPMDS